MLSSASISFPVIPRLTRKVESWRAFVNVVYNLSVFRIPAFFQNFGCGMTDVLIGKHDDPMPALHAIPCGHRLRAHRNAFADGGHPLQHLPHKYVPPVRA